MIKPKLLFNLYQQNLEQGVAKVTSWDDKPPKLWSNINRQIPFGYISWRFWTVATLLIRITTRNTVQPLIYCWWNATGGLIRGRAG
jgi:hypothetical protein